MITNLEQVAMTSEIERSVHGGLSDGHDWIAGKIGEEFTFRTQPDGTITVFVEDEHTGDAVEHTFRVVVQYVCTKQIDA